MARLPSSFHKLSVRARDALCELTVTTEQDFALVEHVLASGNAWHRFERPKPRGGVRVIYAPETPLMDYLKRVLRNVLQGLEMHRCVHGGHPGRSVITNARRHADGGAKAFFLMDLKDAFPSVSQTKFDEVLGVKLRRHIQSAVDVDAVDADAIASVITDIMFVDQILPQGFPTSPGVLNAILYPVDREIGAYLLDRGTKLNTTFRYTRYVDDLTISTSSDTIDRETRKAIQKIVLRNGWKIKKSKTSYMGEAEEGDDERSTKMPVVTGLVVNPDGRLTVPRWKLQKWRAFMHQVVSKEVVSELDRQKIAGIVGYLGMVYEGAIPSIVRKPYEAAKARFGSGNGRLPEGQSGEILDPEETPESMMGHGGTLE